MPDLLHPGPALLWTWAWTWAAVPPAPPPLPTRGQWVCGQQPGAAVWVPCLDTTPGGCHGGLLAAKAGPPPLCSGSGTRGPGPGGLQGGGAELGSTQRPVHSPDRRPSEPGLSSRARRGLCCLLSPCGSVSAGGARKAAVRHLSGLGGARGAAGPRPPGPSGQAPARGPRRGRGRARPSPLRAPPPSCADAVVQGLESGA